MRNIEFINAGAGSGKTYTLTSKLAGLIGKGNTTPSRVILTTFTKLAAEEFRVKARAMLLSKGLHERASEMNSATIGTVHSMALGYIQRYWYLLGLGAGVQAMPEEDEARYIGATLFRVATPEDVSVFSSYADAVQILQAAPPYHVDYDYWKRDVEDLVKKAETFGIMDFGRSLSESMSLFDDIFRDEPEGRIKALRRDVVLRMFRIAEEWRKEFARYKKERDLISYNDMERLFLTLLDNPVVREDISQGIDYVFVDEFQDSNPTQVRIFDKLSDVVGKGSFWVGDPKQAIYDFRGCDTCLTGAVTALIEARAQNGDEGFTYSSLEKSYRSDPALVDLANRVFVPVFARELTPDKVVLRPNNASVLPADLPRIVHWNMVPGRTAKGRESYSQGIVSETLAANVFNLVHGLFPVRQVVDKESGQLRDLRPSDIAVLCRYVDEVKALADRLRKMGIPVSTDVERGDDNIEVAFLCAALNYILGSTNLLDAELAYMYDALAVEDIIEHPEMIRGQEVVIRLDRLKREISGKPVPYVVSSVIDSLDLERKASMWGNGKVRMNALETVKAMAAAYETQCISRGEAATLGGFVNTLSAAGVVIDRSIQSEGVNILTYHKAKGLEWNVVVLASLSDDAFDGKKFYKRNFFGINVQRLTDPTAENLYSEFILRYVPRCWSTSNSNLEASITHNLVTRPDIRQIQSRIRSELSRLLYVGVTRARDVLITFSPKVEEMGWMRNVGIESQGCKDLNGGWGDVWGAGNPKAWVVKTGRDLAEVEDEEEPVTSLVIPGTFTERREKYLAPSSLRDVAAHAAFQCVFPGEGALERITVKGDAGGRYDSLGTCLHDIFAVYKEGEDETGRIVIAAQETVKRYGFAETLPDSVTIVRAMNNLHSFLRRTYGDAVGVYRELPFMYVREGSGQVVSGEMDLVWETEKGCVVVDYKNYPGYDDVLDPESKFFVGKYWSQLECYREALEMAGKKVLDRLVFYAVQGRIIRLSR